MCFTGRVQGPSVEASLSRFQRPNYWLKCVCIWIVPSKQMDAKKKENVVEYIIYLEWLMAGILG